MLPEAAPTRKPCSRASTEWLQWPLVTSRLFTLFSLLSLALLLAYAFLWIRGFWLTDTFNIGRAAYAGNQKTSRTLYLVSDNCRFGIIYRLQHDDVSPDLMAALKRLSPFYFSHDTEPSGPFKLIFADPGDPFWNRLGFEYYDSSNVIYSTPPGYFDRTWAAPFWSVLLLFSILPACRLLALAQQRRTRRRARLGLCQRCGYDLRASKERCPECGTPIPAKEKTDLTADTRG
jgi:hypothetical protein